MAYPQEWYPSMEQKLSAEKEIEAAGKRAREITDQGGVPLLTNVEGHKEEGTVYVPQETMQAYGRSTIPPKQPTELEISVTQKMVQTDKMIVDDMFGGQDPRDITPRNSLEVQDKQQKLIQFNTVRKMAWQEIQKREQAAIKAREDKLKKAEKEKKEIGKLNPGEAKLYTLLDRDVIRLRKWLEKEDNFEHPDYGKVKNQYEESLKRRNELIKTGDKSEQKGITENKYTSAQDVKNAYQNGKLTKDEAKNILQKDFGYK